MTDEENDKKIRILQLKMIACCEEIIRRTREEMREKYAKPVENKRM